MSDGSLFLGSSSPAVYIGSTKAQKVYLGNVLLWSAETPWAVLSDGVLTIYQAYDVEQSGSKLLIDFPTYSVTAGTISNGSISGTGDFKLGSTCTLTATADSGYEFSSMTVDGTEVTTSPYSFKVTKDVEVTATFKSAKSYSVTLSGIASYSFSKGSVANPDSTLYDGVYESSNGGVASSYSAMKISFTGYTTFTIYIRSAAESNYDYTIASTLDAASYPTASGGTYANVDTKGNQNSGTTLGSYTKVTYSTDGGSHYIYVVYRKDGSADTSPDKGYVLIEK